ncbi:hypothetical protein AMS68_001338 [Peltaster fructicola]|uniref:Uncharacterized protein n=1 Tax=Peltaster fructicola TaxID=286661 RepID=A0A6H0XMF4_9PEZI|nr:hypothetical protein AMS68_001338 [Peltaster fructicola]
MELKFVNGRLLIGYRLDAAIEVFYSGQQTQRSTPSPSRALSGQNVAFEEAETEINLVCVLCDGTIEKVKPGEVAWLPFFNHAYIASDSIKERQEIRDSRLEVLYAYLSATDRSSLLALEEQLKRPSNGPYRFALLDEAIKWRLDLPQASDSARGGRGTSSASSQSIFAMETAHSDSQSSMPATFHHTRCVIESASPAHHNTSTVIDLTDTPDTMVEPEDEVFNQKDGISSEFGPKNLNTADAGIKPAATRNWYDAFCMPSDDHAGVNRRSSVQSTLPPRKRPRSSQQATTTSTAVLPLALSTDTTAGGGRRFTIEVPDFDLSCESEVEADDYCEAYLRSSCSQEHA